MEMYAIVENAMDYQNIQFKLNFDEAKAIYDKQKADFDASVDNGGALIKITGDGVLYSGQEFSAQDGVEVLEEYDEYSIEEEDEEQDDE
jgi:hypothetical protein